MKLYEILIETGVTPDDLHHDCKFIAQDGYDGLVSQYEGMPVLFGERNYYGSKYELHDIGRLDDYFELGEDWQTPLSREDFIAAYEAHHG